MCRLAEPPPPPPGNFLLAATDFLPSTLFFFSSFYFYGSNNGFQICHIINHGNVMQEKREDSLKLRPPLNMSKGKNACIYQLLSMYLPGNDERFLSIEIHNPKVSCWVLAQIL